MKKLISIVILIFVAFISYAYTDMQDLRTKANKGDAEAQYELGDWFTGIHDQSDYKMALHYLRKSAEQGNSKAKERLKELTTPGYAAWGDFEIPPYYDLPIFSIEDEKYISESKNEGDAGATLLLGHNYYKTRDYSQAVKYYEECLRMLGDNNFGSIGDEKMDKLYIILDAVAMLGYCHEHGLGVPQNYLKALAYYNLLAGYHTTPEICEEITLIIKQLNNPGLNEFVGECGGEFIDAIFPMPEACRIAGKCSILLLKINETNKGIESLKVNETDKPAENGWSSIGGSADNLWAGETYYKGIGRLLDYNKAFRIFSYIVKQENEHSAVFPFIEYYPDIYADACYRLYECYALGRGTEKDGKKAQYYFDKALTYGSSSALYDDQKRYEISKDL